MTSAAFSGDKSADNESTKQKFLTVYHHPKTSLTLYAVLANTAAKLSAWP